MENNYEGIDPEHPAIELCYVQSLMWKAIPDKSEFEWEILTYLKAKVIKAGRGKYLDFVVKCLSDLDGVFEKDTIIRVGVPLVAFRTAWLSIPVSIKKHCSADNLTMDSSLSSSYSKTSEQRLLQFLSPMH